MFVLDRDTYPPETTSGGLLRVIVSVEPANVPVADTPSVGTNATVDAAPPDPDTVTVT